MVIPFYNEEDNLRPLITELVRVLESLGRSFEVLLIDDGSTDGGLELASRLASRGFSLRVVRLSCHRGQSAALAAGFRFARGELVVTMDADLQNDPHDIPKLLECVENHDLVCGVRIDRQDNRVRRVSSRIANRVRERVLHDGVSDVGCSLKVIRSELLAALPLFEGMHRFLPALLQMQGARVIEVPVHHRRRQRGVSKYGIRNRLWRGVIDLLAVRWLQARYFKLDRAEEIESWKQYRSGWESVSSDKPCSSDASFSSGWSRSVRGKA